MRMWIAGCLLAMLLAGCGAGKKLSPEEDEWRVEPDPPSVLSQLEPKTVEEQLKGQQGVIALTITDRGISPAQIRVKHGGLVKLHVKNSGARPHNIAIPVFGIAGRTLGPGEQNYIEFTASQPGSWPYFSDAPGDPEPGIQGVLVVE